jgi:hypothetical protein
MDVAWVAHAAPGRAERDLCADSAMLAPLAAAFYLWPPLRDGP